MSCHAALRSHLTACPPAAESLWWVLDCVCRLAGENQGSSGMPPAASSREVKGAANEYNRQLLKDGKPMNAAKHLAW